MELANSRIYGFGISEDFDGSEGEDEEDEFQEELQFSLNLGNLATPFLGKDHEYDSGFGLNDSISLDENQFAVLDGINDGLGFGSELDTGIVNEKTFLDGDNDLHAIAKNHSKQLDDGKINWKTSHTPENSTGLTESFPEKSESSTAEPQPIKTNGFKDQEGSRAVKEEAMSLEDLKFLHKEDLLKERRKSASFVNNARKNSETYPEKEAVVSDAGESFGSSDDDEDVAEEDLVSASWVDNLDIDMASFNSHRNESYFPDHVNMDDRSDDEFLLGLLSSDSSVENLNDDERDDVDLIGWECFFDDSSDELDPLTRNSRGATQRRHSFSTSRPQDDGDTTDEELPQLCEPKLSRSISLQEAPSNTSSTIHDPLTSAFSDSPFSQVSSIPTAATGLELPHSNETSLVKDTSYSENHDNINGPILASFVDTSAELNDVPSFELDPKLDFSQPKPPVLGTWKSEPNHLFGFIDGKHSHSLYEDKFNASKKGDVEPLAPARSSNSTGGAEEPSLDDILDTSLLQAATTNNDTKPEESVTNQEDHLLSRWERIPIGTFRRNQYIKSMARKDELIRDEWCTLAIKTREKRRHKQRSATLNNVSSIAAKPKHSRKARRALKKKAKKITYRQLHSDFQSTLEDDRTDGSYFDNDYETVGLGLGPELSPLFEVLESTGY